jgi:hypothetical protein
MPVTGALSAVRRPGDDAAAPDQARPNAASSTRELPFGQAPAALELLSGREVIGRVVLRC